jgi:hypothetical protein
MSNVKEALDKILAKFGWVSAPSDLLHEAADSRFEE